MDLNKEIFKDEVSNFVTSLQKLLPKKKSFIIEIERPKITRLADVHAEAKSVFPRCFIGARLVILREILDRVKLIQSYSFGKPNESYKCYTQLIHKEMEPKATGDGIVVDWSGSATASYNEILDGGYEMRLTSKIKDLVSSENELVFEKDNGTSVGSISCAMKDVDPKSFQLVADYMYRVMPEFSTGAQLRMKPVAYPSSPDLSVSARYEKASVVISSTLSRFGFQVCLFKKFSPNLRIATIVNDHNKEPATIGLALHKKYQNGTDVKIFVDSQRCGGFTVQKDVLFHESQNEIRVVRLVGSTLIDRQKRVRFGFGFNLDF